MCISIPPNGSSKSHVSRGRKEKKREGANIFYIKEVKKIKNIAK